MSRKTDFVTKYLPYCLTAVVLAVVVYVRIRLLSVPLERDEGEFAYTGQLLLKGIPPFTHAYTMKLPGVSVIYALCLLLFGQTAAGIHAGLLLVNGACICLVYLLASRLFDRKAALFSSASYAVLSLSSSVYGVFAHATHFVVLFVLAGLLLLLRYLDTRHKPLLLGSGFCFGMAITMKQHAVILLLFAFLQLLWHVRKDPGGAKKPALSGSFLFLSGAVIPVVLIVVWMVAAGSFENFWFWTVQYAREYTSGQTLGSGWKNFQESFLYIARSQLPLWLLAGLGSVVLCTKRRASAGGPFVCGYLVFSFLAICPGLYFREHYFVLLLPAVAVLAGVGASSAGLFFPPGRAERFALTIEAVLFLAAIAYGLNQEKATFFVRSPLAVSRAIYGESPFPEAVEIAAYLKKQTAATDKIAVLGSEPEIFFYADRLSATGHIYMYGLMENQPYAERMQLQMIREIEAARPAYVVFVNINLSWLMEESSVKTLFEWGERYLKDHYAPVGVIDITSANARYNWDIAASGEIRPVSRSYVTVFKRKSG